MEQRIVSFLLDRRRQDLRKPMVSSNKMYDVPITYIIITYYHNLNVYVYVAAHVLYLATKIFTSEM